MWPYDHGDIGKSEPFAPWLRSLLETWRAESTTLRVAWVRVGRSPLGWNQVELPAASCRRVVALVRALADIAGARITGSYGDLRLRTAGESSWTKTDERNVEVHIARDRLAELAAALETESSAEIPGLDARISFSDL